MNNEGHMGFRTKLPLKEGNSGINVAAADGQMGTIMKFYREWQLSGDEEFFFKYWPKVKTVLAFAWVENGWDGDVDGVRNVGLAPVCFNVIELKLKEDFSLKSNKKLNWI